MTDSTSIAAFDNIIAIKIKPRSLSECNRVIIAVNLKEPLCSVSVQASLHALCRERERERKRELRFRRTSGFNGERVRSRTRGIHYESRGVHGRRKGATMNEDKWAEI